MEYKKVSPLATLAIFSMALMGMGITVVTPAMQTLIAYWGPGGASGAEIPLTSIYMISTLPTLVMVPATLLAGAIAGKQVKFRTLAILGSALFVIGGCLPAVITNSFAMVIFGRVLFGIGAGLISPLGNALILGLYEPKTAASYLGYGTLLMNAGGIAFQYLGGVLSGMSWSMTFWGHGVAVIALIMAFFIPEPPKVEAPAGAQEVKKEKMSPLIWITGAGFFLFNIGNYPLMMNLSSIFTAKGIGDGVAAATALSIYTVAGCVAGLIFGKVFATINRFAVPVGFLLAAVGQFFISMGTNVAMMSVGTACIGFGFSFVMPAFFAYIGMWTAPSTVALATSINLGLNSVSGFVCSYYLSGIVAKFSPEAIEGVDGLQYPGFLYTEVYWAIAISIAMAVIFLVFNPLKYAKNAPAAAPQEGPTEA
ncbi:Predicted arabinose efflux permease, MFS family [Acetitomaculum ruminis DSM 5522]|uniref:Predicted arabinose efflux permease, MFS family n=1 Tax=Acetitomaculum ruminis DSM 5522 TaxID=1120918 RepID=A0A1I0XN38_9FIRM|nr:MFS transporter [Acetitomaculum ruminis]SFB02314.1 Predicted arabinose efflux permease, MFS family [Acetitomaculum ruminis DSM 5522]